MHYHIHTALKEDMDKAVAWVQNQDIAGRCIGCIRRPTSRKKVWLELRAIDQNYREDYNARPTTVTIGNDQPVLVLSEWYRRRLGIGKNEEYDLDIEELKKGRLVEFLRGLQIGLRHPDSNIRCATHASIFGLLLGCMGFIVGVVSWFT